MGIADNNFIIHGVMSHLINRGKKLYCTFADFTKAFDYVNRNILWYKLIQFGMRGKMVKTIQSIYTRVEYNNELSN